VIFFAPIFRVRAPVPVLAYMTEFHSMQPPAPRLLSSRAEGARQLSIAVRSLDYLLANKTFQTRRIGKKVLITHDSLRRFDSADHFGRAGRGPGINKSNVVCTCSNRAATKI
jgi:hypothetical protein